jgi:transposase
MSNALGQLPLGRAATALSARWFGEYRKQEFARTVASADRIVAVCRWLFEALARNGNSSQKVALRCRLLLLAGQGLANHSIAQQLHVSRPTVLALRAAFVRDGMAAVTGIRRRKRQAKVLTPELEQQILDTTLKTRPGDGSTHWSVRTLFIGSGSVTTCNRIAWSASN